VHDDRLQLVERYPSVYALANAALTAGVSLAATISLHLSAHYLDYDPIYLGASDWRILPVIDHPDDHARLLLSGTGLTHQRSAQQRQAMHAADASPTDSLLMYEWGVQGGRPQRDQIGIAPEWFYKGNGGLLRAHGETLIVPPYADDGGEEPEIAGIYLIDPAGAPRRIGMAVGNEFSDHVLERRNYLYLAHSKLRNCAVGPELVLDPDFDDVRGEVAIERAGAIVWSRPIRSGEQAMCHSLRNLEHHHFKYAEHRRPGDLHVHFFGADAFSFGAGIALQAGDVMRVQFQGFGRPLLNPVAFERQPQLVPVLPV
jgi:hypothetical protein